VHIGKSGGETIKSVLEFGCHAKRNHAWKQKCLAELPDSQLSRSTQGYLHCFQQTRSSVSVGQATGFLYSLRHPLHRTTSWLHYVHPKYCVRQSEGNETTHPASSTVTSLSGHTATYQNCRAYRNIYEEQPQGWMAQFFVHCQLDSMAAWAQAVLLSNTTANSGNSSKHSKTTSACRKLARDALVGTTGSVHDIPLASHLMANIRVNYQLTAGRRLLQAQRNTTTSTRPSIFVIRTEHLWQDMAALDRKLGGSGSFGGKAQAAFVANPSPNHVQPPNRHPKDRITATNHIASQSQQASSLLSILETQALCCGLKLELLAYRTLIDQADNLSPTEKADTLQAALQQCHWRSWQDLMGCRL
jgi:hypothetical protein